LRSGCLSRRAIGVGVFSVRAASGVALAPEPQRAIEVGPESPRIVGRSDPHFSLFLRNRMSETSDPNS